MFRKYLFSILISLLFISLVYANEFTNTYRFEIPSTATRDWTSIISNDYISLDRILTILSTDSGLNINLTTVLSKDAAWSDTGTTVKLIDSSDRVGLGTSSATCSLDVVGGIKTTGSIGSNSGHFRSDAGLEVQGTTGLISLLQTTNPGNTSNETAIAFGAYDSGGTIKKTSSISSYWGNTDATSGYSVLNFNPTYAGGGSDNSSMKLYGNDGISIFPTSNGRSAYDGPGEDVLEVLGKLSVDSTGVLYNGDGRFGLNVVGGMDYLDASPLDIRSINAIGDGTAFDGTEVSGQRLYGVTAQFRNITDDANSFSQINFRNRSTGVAVARIVGVATGSDAMDLVFVTENSTPTEKVRIKGNGYVGIGTTAPTLSLDVMGQISADAFRFDIQTSSPDTATLRGAGLYVSPDAGGASSSLLFYDGSNWKKVNLI